MMLAETIDMGLKDAVDVLLVAVLFWLLIRWSRRVRAHLALLGIAAVGVVYAGVLQLDLQLTAWILRGFFAAFVVLVVVMFQSDLRRLFERIAVFSLRRRPKRTNNDGILLLSQALAELARTRTGALVVVPGREPVERHLQGSVPLDAEISVELLLSIFDASSPGHDGAVIVQGDRLACFGARLPLTQDPGRLAGRGTRHAAALGISEVCDAMCLVVSEERGSLSIAAGGRLETLEQPTHAGGAVRRHLSALDSPHGRPYWQWPRLRAAALEAGAALSLALVCWLALGPGSEIGEATRTVSIVVENLPDGYVLEGVTPETIEVTFAGPYRQLLLSTGDKLQITIDALLVRLGRRTFALSRDAVHHPPGLTVVSIDPSKAVLSVRETRD